eukprot:4842520-Pyramimonas_sp.AAC.1
MLRRYVLASSKLPICNKFARHGRLLNIHDAEDEAEESAHDKGGREHHVHLPLLYSRQYVYNEPERYAYCWGDPPELAPILQGERNGQFKAERTVLVNWENGFAKGHRKGANTRTIDTKRQIW